MGFNRWSTHETDESYTDGEKLLGFFFFLEWGRVSLAEEYLFQCFDKKSTSSNGLRCIDTMYTHDCKL